MSNYAAKVHKDGPDALVVEAGGTIETQKGAITKLDGYAAHIHRQAIATYDFAVNGGAIGAINSGAKLPDNAVITGGFIEVLTTCTTAGADAGTMAVKVQGAGDIVAAVAVSDASNPWDAGFHAVVPDGTLAKFIKLTAEREVVFTIAGQAFTAGKIKVVLDYILTE